MAIWLGVCNVRAFRQETLFEALGTPTAWMGVLKISLALLYHCIGPFHLTRFLVYTEKCSEVLKTMKLDQITHCIAFHCSEVDYGTSTPSKHPQPELPSSGIPVLLPAKEGDDPTAALALAISNASAHFRDHAAGMWDAVGRDAECAARALRARKAEAPRET